MLLVDSSIQVLYFIQAWRNDGRDGAIKDDPFLKAPLLQILIKRNINEEGLGGVVQCFFLEVDDDGCV